MQDVLRALEQRAGAGRPVTVALVGAGRFGTTVAAQLGQMRGIRLAVVADIRTQNAVAAFQAAGHVPDDVVSAASAGDVASAVQRGRPVMVEDALLAATAPVDVLVEVTGRPAVAAQVIPAALERGVHVVNVTVEADVLLGSLFAHLAARHGAVYTLADGDQPGCARRLVDWARALGYRIVAAGRGTLRYPFDRYGTPEEVFARYGFSDDLVQRRRLNARMYNSFRDGSKAQIEMTALANCTGLVPDRRGMHEPSAGLSALPSLMALRQHGGLLEREGVVDLANAVAAGGQSLLPDGIANGVWVVLTTDNPLLQEDLAFYGLPSGAGGRTALLYRPYHLCGIEAPLSVAEAALFGRATAAPLPHPIADVVTFAKRALRAGEFLDGSGGATVYGLIERWEQARAENLLPLGLAEGVRLRRDRARDEAITYADVELDETAPVVRLRRELERSLSRTAAGAANAADEAAR
jgi:predicted homoserine dehydrogenase-like protein